MLDKNSARRCGPYYINRNKRPKATYGPFGSNVTHLTSPSLKIQFSNLTLKFKFEFLKICYTVFCRYYPHEFWWTAFVQWFRRRSCLKPRSPLALLNNVEVSWKQAGASSMAKMKWYISPENPITPQIWNSDLQVCSFIWLQFQPHFMMAIARYNKPYWR